MSKISEKEIAAARKAAGLKFTGTWLDNMVIAALEAAANARAEVADPLLAHPTVPEGWQPIEIAKDGVVRFRANAVVDWLFMNGKLNLNDIPTRELPIEDVEQFWQMLGYSVSGFGDLSFVRDETVARADAIASELLAQSKPPVAAAEKEGE